MHVAATAHTHDSDEAIARLVQGGDIEAFGILVDRYEQKLLRYGRKFLARGEDIEDIVQDIFVSAYQNIQGFDSSLRVSAWLYRIAHNAFVNALRKDGRITFGVDLDSLVSHHGSADAPEAERDVKEMRILLERGLDMIAPKYREVLILHYFEELAYKDIADILQVPIGTISIRMKRGKEALKAKIEQSL